ncbi:MAG: pilus assembly protein [Pasteurellaceae bacterium]|nr:pilus assembly protein [Pasteurellaceae bacterium]
MMKLRYINVFIKNKMGATTVEFALTIGLFLAVIFAFFELARLSVLSAYMDLTLSQAVKATKNSRVTGADYEEAFRQNLTATLNHIQEENKGLKLLNMDNTNLIQFEVKYAESVSALVQGQFRQTLDQNNSKILEPGKEAALAEYSFQYEYQPLFFWFPKTLIKPLFQRRLIVLQEYERSEHNIY